MISSRTPEGDPNLCPVCGKDARIEPSTVPIRDAPCPHSSIGEAEASKVSPGNPTDYVILFAPIMYDKHVAGLIEIWQDPNSGPDAQRGYLQFTVRMAGLASGFARTAAVG